MKTIMKLEELTTIEQLSQFLVGTQAVIFKLNTDKKRKGSNQNGTYLLKRIFAIFVMLLGYAALTQPTKHGHRHYFVGRISAA